VNLRKQQFKIKNICQTCGHRYNETGHYKNTYLIMVMKDFDPTVNITHTCHECNFTTDSLICIEYYLLLQTIRFILEECPSKEGHVLLFSEVYMKNVPHNNSSLDNVEQYEQFKASIVLTHDEYTMLCYMIEAC